MKFLLPTLFCAGLVAPSVALSATIEAAGGMALVKASKGDVRSLFLIDERIDKRTIIQEGFDLDGPASVSHAEGVGSFAVEIVGSAFQNEERISRAEVDTEFYVPIEFGYTVVSQTQIHLDISNRDSVARNLFYEFSLSGLMLELIGAGQNYNPFDREYDAGSLGTSIGTAAAHMIFSIHYGEDDVNVLEAGVTRPFTDLEIYRAEAQMWTFSDAGGNLQLNTAPPKNFNRNVTYLTSDGFVEGFRVDMDPIKGILDLGVFKPGEERYMNIQSYIEVLSSGDEHALAGTIGDPSVDYSRVYAGPAITPDPSVVPLPASGWMLMFGFGLLSFARRRL